MNLLLFRNIISKVWTEDFSQEVLICLVRAGMVIANIRIWRDFIISRDSDVRKNRGSNIKVELNNRNHRPVKEVKTKVNIKLGSWIR